MISLNQEQTLSYYDGSFAVQIQAHLLVSFEFLATAQLIQLLMLRSWTFRSAP
jgi:hypothetical protein